MPPKLDIVWPYGRGKILGERQTCWKEIEVEGNFINDAASNADYFLLEYFCIYCVLVAKEEDISVTI